MDAPPRARFEELVLPHLDAGYRLARWLVGDAALAEDVVQDAAVRALGHVASFQGGDGRAWWLRIVRNVAYDTIAARRRVHGVPVGEDLVDPSAGPEALVARREGETMLAAALAALPSDLRTCLLLKEMEGLSYKEIAEVTGVPIGTVMSRLWRARRALLDGGAA